jgi:hypothetical protein
MVKMRVARKQREIVLHDKSSNPQIDWYRARVSFPKTRVHLVLNLDGGVKCGVFLPGAGPRIQIAREHCFRLVLRSEANSVQPLSRNNSIEPQMDDDGRR